MNDTFVIGIVSVAVLGGSAQWLGWRLKLPSILLLLIFGMLAGPDGVGLIPTEAMFGDLLLPLVAIAVAILLFEGGLTLHLPELGDQLRVVGRLVTLGAAITWVLSALAAHYVLGLSWPLAILIGSILTVTGPTVVIPLLRQIRPTGPGGAVLKWEGILIDPIGAVLAVLVFEALVDGAFASAFVGIGKTIVFGSLFGLLPAFLLVLCLQRYWIPDHLHSASALALALLGYALANGFQHESGLLAVTVMGVALANQDRVDITHITEFKENLQILIISALFVVLAAGVEWSALAALINLRFALFLAILVLLVRPLAVSLCTLDGRLKGPDRLFVSAMAPRGVVAAAVTAVFALRLEEEGFAGAEQLVPIMFLVIAGSVAIYGLIGRPLALRLGLAERNPNGFLIIGAHPFARGLAQALQEAGLPILVVDTNPGLVRLASQRGLPVYHGSVLSDQAAQDLDLPVIGNLLALTANDEVNALSARHYVHLFGRQNLFQLAPGRVSQGESSELSPGLRARVLGAAGLTYEELQRRYASGQRFISKRWTGEVGVGAWAREHGEEAVPLIVVRPNGAVIVGSPGQVLEIKSGDTVIAMRAEPGS